jgi:glyceraldehyde 3-phosphate dehydrogenase
MKKGNKTRVAINGMGRIGRAALKLVLEQPELELAAINDIGAPDNLVYLLKYDTVYRRYKKAICLENGNLLVDDQKIRILQEKDPAKLPWKDLGCDIVLECTGVFTKKEHLVKHLEAGAKTVILSAPIKGEGDVATVVYGVNKPEGETPELLSCASCTTNCITPVVEIMNRRFGVKKAAMTTLHAYTASQSIVDEPSKKPRNGRAGASNFVPSTTGAAVATTKALPSLKGKFNGLAVRAPVPVGSLADLVFFLERETSVDEVNNIFREEAATERYKEVLTVSEDPIVSSDIIQDTHASIVDLTLTQVVDGDLVKVMSWYDNEWGYTSQMVREVVLLARARQDLARARKTA